MMRRLKFRFTLRVAMIVVVLVAVGLIPVMRHRDRLRKQVRAEYQNATLTREVAEIALAEYEASRQQDLQTAEGEIALAESDQKRAEERAKWSKRIVEKGYLLDVSHTSDQLSLRRAEFALEQAKTKKKVMDISLRHLKGDVLKARTIEAAKRAEVERQERGVFSALFGR